MEVFIGTFIGTFKRTGVLFGHSRPAQISGTEPVPIAAGYDKVRPFILLKINFRND